MGKIAFLLAGQGAQKPGMGKSFYENSPAAKKLLDSLEMLRPGTLQICFEGEQETLNRTIHTQPCLFLADLACAVAATEAGLSPDMCAGFSLGEWAAAALTGLLTPEDAFRLVILRAERMDDCALRHPGAMTAVLKLSAEQVQDLAAEFREVYPVNFNAPGQTVVASSRDEVEAFEARVKQAGGRAMRLKVSGAFHSPYMEDARQALSDALEGVGLREAQIPLYANLTAEPYNKDVAREWLSRQAASPVQWQRTIEAMLRQGAETFVELGPGATLTGLGRRMAPEKTWINVEDSEGLNKALETVRRNAC